MSATNKRRKSPKSGEPQKNQRSVNPQKNPKNSGGPPIPAAPYYVVERGESELAALQKKKSVFMSAAILLFVVSCFLPSDVRFYAGYEALNYIFALLIVAGLTFSAYVGVQNFKKHALRAVILKSDAPKRGFSRGTTYYAYEGFTVLMFALLIVQSVIAFLARDAFAYAGEACMLAAVGFAVTSRQLLYNANKDARLTGEPTAASAVSAADNTGGSAEDFYSAKAVSENNSGSGSEESGGENKGGGA